MGFFLISKPVRERVEISTKRIGIEDRQKFILYTDLPHNHCRKEVGTLQPTDQIHPTFVFENSYTGTWPHPIIYILPMAVYKLQLQPSRMYMPCKVITISLASTENIVDLQSLHLLNTGNDV